MGAWNTHRWWAWLAALAFLLASPCVVLAQDTDESVEDPARVEEALVMYERARDRYEAGDFERAVLLLEEALAVHDAPELHYNLARALQELGRWVEARREYVVFRERSPDSASRERVDARIAQLDQRIAEEAAAERAAAERAAAERAAAERAETGSAPSASLEPAPWVLLGGGAAVAAAGIPFGALFLDAEATAANAPSHAEAFGPANDATTYAIVANIMFGVGAVTGIVGLVWGLVSLSQE